MSRKRRNDPAARERARRAAAARTVPPTEPASTRRDAARTCAWCGGAIYVKRVGRIPKWCSASCRQRAWEQSRAAASGRSAVTVVERLVAAPAVDRPRRSADWASVLNDLADQLDQDHIYARDLPDLAHSLDQVIHAYRRQTDRRPTPPKPPQ
jgi:hypothetical protein